MDGNGVFGFDKPMLISYPFSEGEAMKINKPLLSSLLKETPEARKKRVSSGVKFRAAVFESEKDRQKRRQNQRRQLRQHLHAEASAAATAATAAAVRAGKTCQENNSGISV